MMKLKIFMRKILFRYLNLIRLLCYYLIDFRRFSKYSYALSKKYSEKNLEAIITLNYHSLEKGLSNINFRPGFGKKAIDGLMKYMIIFYKSGFSKENTRFLIGLDVLRKYVEKNRAFNIDVKYIENFIYKHSNEQNELSELGGVIINSFSNIERDSKGDFEKLVNSRHSVRDYAEGNVDINSLNAALKLAMKTPSVCNRQSWKTHVILDKNNIKKILEIQSGFRGHGNNISGLLVITSDISAFSTAPERNQSFIDGGMYSMSLLYALHFEGIAACALNSNLNQKRERKVRDLLKIDKNEVMIMFISLGLYLDKFETPMSTRDNYLDHISYYNSEGEKV